MIHFVPKELEGNVNVPQENMLFELGRLAGGSILLLLLAYFLLGWGIDFLVPMLPVEMEKNIERVYASQLQRDSIVNADSEQLQAILDRLQATQNNLPIAYTVYLMKSSTVNALALPGGNIILYTGLLEKLESENEKAFVLAHELGHFAHRDHLRGLGRSIIMRLALVTFFGSDSILGKLSLHSSDLLGMQFSQQQETEADNYALDVLNASEKQVSGALQFFEHLKQIEASEPSLGMLSTHPATNQRLLQMKRRIRQKGYLL